MDLRQLRYFVTLAGEQHFGRAADALHIAQPALTRQIQLLESDLGVRLFERHTRGASLTEAGALLLARAQFLLRYADQTRNDISQHQREPAGTVVIGLSAGIAPLLAVPLVLRMKEQFPSVRLRFVDGFAPALHGMLLNNEIDLAVLNKSVRATDLSLKPLLREQICLIGRSGDVRLGQKSMRIGDLAGIQLVMPGLAKSGMRLELEALTASEGIELETVVEVESVDVAKRLILAGVGMAIHFAAVWHDDIEAGRLAAVPIDGLYFDRVVARATDRPPSQAAEALLRVLHEAVQDEVRGGRWPYATLLDP